MLTRSLDAVISATRALPDHLLVVRRAYSGSPAALSALGRLQDALIEVDRAIAGRTAEGPDTAPSPQRLSLIHI